MSIDFNLFREDFMKQKYGVQLKGRLMRLVIRIKQKKLTLGYK